APARHRRPGCRQQLLQRLVGGWNPRIPHPELRTERAALGGHDAACARRVQREVGAQPSLVRGRTLAGGLLAVDPRARRLRIGGVELAAPDGVPGLLEESAVPFEQFTQRHRRASTLCDRMTHVLLYSVTSGRMRPGRIDAPGQACMTPIDPTAAVGIVGAGTMGSGIAQVAAVAGHEVRIYDAQQGAATRAVGTIAASLARAAAKGRLSHDAATAATDRVHAVRSVADLGGCELVIEAVVEDLGV